MKLWPDVAKRIYPMLSKHMKTPSDTKEGCPPQQQIYQAAGDFASRSEPDTAFQGAFISPGLDEHGTRGTADIPEPPKHHHKRSWRTNSIDDHELSLQAMHAERPESLQAELDRLCSSTTQGPSSTASLRTETERLAALMSSDTHRCNSSEQQSATPTAPVSHNRSASAAPGLAAVDPQNPEPLSAPSVVERSIALSRHLPSLPLAPHADMMMQSMRGPQSRFRTPGDAIRSKSWALGRPRWQRWGVISAALASGALVTQSSGSEHVLWGVLSSMPLHSSLPQRAAHSHLVADRHLCSQHPGSMCR